MNINNIRPLSNQLLIEVIPPDKETSSGILLPDKQFQTGEPVRAYIKKMCPRIDSSQDEFNALYDAYIDSIPVLVHLYLGAARTKQQLDATHYLIDKDLVLAIL